MNFLKKMGTIKVVNLILFLFCMLITVGIYQYIKLGFCVNECSYETMSGVLKPLYAAGKVLLVILGVLLLFPSQVFRKWLYVAPFVILLTFNRVLAVSVYSSGIGTIDRVHMAQYGMYLLGIITIVLIIIDYLKTRKSAQR